MIDRRQPDNRHPDEIYLQQAQEEDARLQPDPELALSSGRANRAQMWVVALSAAAIVGLVLYGVSRTQQAPETAAAPPAQTTGAAPSAEQPVAPEQPAQEPGKQGPSDSAR